METGKMPSSTFFARAFILAAGLAFLFQCSAFAQSNCSEEERKALVAAGLKPDKISELCAPATSPPVFIKLSNDLSNRFLKVFVPLTFRINSGGAAREIVIPDYLYCGPRNSDEEAAVIAVGYVGSPSKAYESSYFLRSSQLLHLADCSLTDSQLASKVSALDTKTWIGVDNKSVFLPNIQLALHGSSLTLSPSKVIFGQDSVLDGTLRSDIGTQLSSQQARNVSLDAIPVNTSVEGKKTAISVRPYFAKDNVFLAAKVKSGGLASAFPPLTDLQGLVTGVQTANSQIRIPIAVANEFVASYLDATPAAIEISGSPIKGLKLVQAAVALYGGEVVMSGLLRDEATHEFTIKVNLNKDSFVVDNAEISFIPKVCSAGAGYATCIVENAAGPAIASQVSGLLTKIIVSKPFLNFTQVVDFPFDIEGRAYSVQGRILRQFVSAQIIGLDANLDIIKR